MAQYASRLAQPYLDSEFEDRTFAPKPLELPDKGLARAAFLGYMLDGLGPHIQSTAQWDVESAKAVACRRLAAHLPSDQEFCDVVEGVIAATSQYASRPQNGDGQVYYQGAEGARPTFSIGERYKELLNQLRSLAEFGVFNRPVPTSVTASNGEPVEVCVDLAWGETGTAVPGLREVVHDCRKWLQGGDVKVGCFFLGERSTAHLNVQYLLDVLGDNLLAISANKDEVAIGNVKDKISQFGSKYSRVLLQQEILGCVDWKLVSSECGIPIKWGESGLVPAGAKGLTMYSFLLALESLGDLQDRYVMFHDSDFVAPYEAFFAVPLALPFVVPGGGDASGPEMIITAKTGPGRNNEGWTNFMNRVFNDERYTLESRKTALLASTIVWPLTGMRIVSGSVVREMPWANSQGVETVLDIGVAARCIEQGRLGLYQVVNGNPVVENGVMTADRDHVLVHCVGGLAERILRFGKPFHRFSVEDIRKFNGEYCIETIPGFYQNHYQGPSKGAVFRPDAILPSIAQLGEMGAVDLDKVACIVGGTV